MERARKLFEGGENIARKSLEQAEAMVTADRLKLQAAEQRFLLEWGPEIEKDRARTHRRNFVWGDGAHPRGTCLGRSS